MQLYVLFINPLHMILTVKLYLSNSYTNPHTRNYLFVLTVGAWVTCGEARAES